MAVVKGYPIKVVARRTGLTQHVIRAWERRYSVVTPERTDTNRRLYTEADIERLRLLRRLCEAGHSIGTISRLPTQDLGRLLEVELQAASLVSEGLARAQVGPYPLEQSLAAVRRLDSDSLDSILRQCANLFGEAEFSDNLIIPLTEEIGNLWAQGRLGIAHEHLATSAMRNVLGARLSGARPNPGAPVLVSTTPAGELHELGALLVATNAAVLGWRVVYLGPDIPAQDIASACREHEARILALSIVHIAERERLVAEIERLCMLAPKSTQVLVGGRGASVVADRLREIGAHLLADLPALRQHLHSEPS